MNTYGSDRVAFDPCSLFPFAHVPILSMVFGFRVCSKSAMKLSYVLWANARVTLGYVSGHEGYET